MAQTLYASFADAALAEKAAGALLDYGVRQEDISLVANEEHGRTTTTAGAAIADTSAGVGRGVSNVGDSTIDASKSAGHRLAQAGDRVAGAVTGAVGATGTAAGFEAAGDQHAMNAEGRAAMAGNESAVHGSPAGRSDLDPMNHDDATVGTHNSTDLAAKHGISTTTPEDAGQGAVKGAGVGLGVGVAAALASLFIPGFGLVYGMGALATALGGAALTTAAGAAAGGVAGYLKDQGVPGEAVQRYTGTVEHGGAMLAVHVPSGNIDQATIEQILSKYSASDVSTY